MAYTGSGFSPSEMRAMRKRALKRRAAKAGVAGKKRRTSTTAKQKAASRKNLEKARAAKKRGGVKVSRKNLPKSMRRPANYLFGSVWD